MSDMGKNEVVLLIDCGGLSFHHAKHGTPLAFMQLMDLFVVTMITKGIHNLPSILNKYLKKYTKKNKGSSFPKIVTLAPPFH